MVNVALDVAGWKIWYTIALLLYWNWTQNNVTSLKFKINQKRITYTKNLKCKLRYYNVLNIN